MTMIFTRAPLRISLGGGGTDLPSYYREHGGFLVAGAIDKYVYMLTHTVFQRRFRLKYSALEEVDDPRDIKHPILREALTRYWSGSPLEIASLADIPAGTGLGSSGAYTVCLLKALAIAGKQATTPGAIAEAACHIEIDLLGEPIGKQDQYAAAHGGICAYTFNADDTVSVESLNLSEETLDALRDRLLLFYTGETRSASEILRDQDTRTRELDKAMLANLDRTKEIGLESRALLESGDLDAIRRADARALAQQACALERHVDNGDRRPLRAGAPQRCHRRQDRGRRRRRVPARLHRGRDRHAQGPLRGRRG